MWLAWVIFVLYPLSFGPAVKIHRRSPAARRTIETIYAPLILVMDQNSMLESVTLWYINRFWKES
jgi:hypothetical protein